MHFAAVPDERLSECATTPADVRAVRKIMGESRQIGATAAGIG